MPLSSCGRGSSTRPCRRAAGCTSWSTSRCTTASGAPCASTGACRCTGPGWPSRGTPPPSRPPCRRCAPGWPTPCSTAPSRRAGCCAPSRSTAARVTRRRPCSSASVPEGRAWPGTPSPGWRGASTEGVRDLVDRVFTRGNVALVLDGAPPAGLTLGLPEGARLPVPDAPRADDDPRPAAYTTAGRLVLSGEVPRTAPATFLPVVLQDMLRRDLREGAGGAYAPWSSYEGVDPDTAVVLAGSDVAESLLPTVAHLATSGLSALSSRGPLRGRRRGRRRRCAPAPGRPLRRGLLRRPRRHGPPPRPRGPGARGGARGGRGSDARRRGSPPAAVRRLVLARGPARCGVERRRCPCSDADGHAAVAG